MKQWKKKKIKKAYVLEVIKRDSVEPAVDLIYTELLVGVNNVLIFKEIFSLLLPLLEMIKKKLHLVKCEVGQS